MTSYPGRRGERERERESSTRLPFLPLLSLDTPKNKERKRRGCQIRSDLVLHTHARMRITPYTYTQPSPPLPSPRHATPRRSKVPFIYGIVSPLGPSLHLIYPKQTDGSTNVSAIPPGRYWGSAFTSVPQKGSPPKKKTPPPKRSPR